MRHPMARLYTLEPSTGIESMRACCAKTLLVANVHACVCVCARACVQAMYVCVRLCSHSRNNVYTTITLEVLVCGVGLALRTGMAFGSQKLRSKLQTKLRQ